MYSHQFAPPATTAEPRSRRATKPVWLKAPSLAAVIGAVILATAVVLALTLSGPGRIHTSFHRAPAQSLPRFSPPLVPHGYVRATDSHQLIPIR